MKKSFGMRLSELRRSQGWSQTQVAEMLTLRGWSVRTQAVSKWEKDTTLPNAAEFLILCELYGVRDVQRVFLSEEREEPRQLPVYTMAVSAGRGQFLSDDDCELWSVGSEVPVQADFGVRIAGDSMEPRFVSGQLVWVRRQQTLEPGEIGIFLYNGEGYCKKLDVPQGKVSLVSLNPAYPPIRVGEGDELRVFGKVVG